MQHVLKEDCWSGLDFSAWNQLSNWDNKAMVKILDTSELTLKQVAKSIADWIFEKDNNNSSEITSKTTYKIIVDHEPSQSDNDAVMEGLKT